ncbi:MULTISPECIES: cytochrome c oxidase subunit IVB [Jeotgalibacillus]|uniref:Cytochrome B6 n=1 Tax=Jeotgalibacillus campisalis TaxID=220754 RepID=A0A0C2RBA0_9BACL|nr:MULTISPECIES: cytochrome c oxidase subunit IVB [Jeotgalibacillus]KIL47590.1 cytochrome B6 [Jeotgalibacillus campisalis]MDG5470165.1 cytochrome c oxidase subunit IVB [Jeotgalibacillus sp. ET6]
MATQQSTSANPKVNYEYRRKKAAEEMRKHVTSFALMIFVTLIAFIMVLAGFDKTFVYPVLLALAALQVVLQLYYFMHMSHKGHGAAALFLYSGALVAFITILTFLTIVWW